MKYVWVVINGVLERVELYDLDVLLDPDLMDVVYIGPEENGMRINGIRVVIFLDNAAGKYYAARDCKAYV